MDYQNTIYYLATKDNVIESLKSLYTRQGFIFKGLDARLGLPEDINCLLLVEPLQLGRNYVSVNQLWKNYLYKHRPETQLLVATYAQGKHANLFSLLDLPPDLAQFLSAVKPVKDYPFAYIGATEKLGEKRDQYLDTWSISLPHSGQPAIVEMQHFLDGHDRHKSFMAQLFRLRTLLRKDVRVSEQQINSLTDLKQEYSYLLQRWYYYEKLFDVLPFAPTLKLIAENLFFVKEQLDKLAFPDAEAQDKLAEIYQLTQDEIKPIVFPLDYW